MPESRAGRVLLVAVAVPAALGLALLAASEGSLLPRAWAGEFYVVKGTTALVAVLLVLWHMSRTWASVTSTAQRLRYLCLLAFVWLVASASVAQSAEDAPIAGRNVAGFLACVLTIVAMVVSIHADRRRP